MDKKRSAYTTTDPKSKGEKQKLRETSGKARGDCDASVSSSHTQFFKREKYKPEYRRITTDEYFGHSESVSGSSDTFRCVHGAEGKVYTEKGRLKRNLLKQFDPIPNDPKWTDKCEAAYGMGETLAFLVQDPAGRAQPDRLEAHLRDFALTSRHGYRIDELSHLCIIIDYLVENLNRIPKLREGTLMLMNNMDKPIILKAASDVISQFETLVNYFGFLGCLLMRLEDDELFTVVSRAVLEQLSAAGDSRGSGGLGGSGGMQGAKWLGGAGQRRAVLSAAAPALRQTAVLMLPLARSFRFPTFLQIALLLACDSADNCIEMIKGNIIESILYRFNPFFPERDLPEYEFDPADPQDFRVKLGDSGIHMASTLSLLLVLVKTLKHHLDDNPLHCPLVPCPDYNSQRCFIWAFRLESRAREHGHERTCLTALAAALLRCYPGRLHAFSNLLMPDVLALSVLTEIPPPHHRWTRTVNFNTSQLDVLFKKLLIYLSVDFLKSFPYNKFMAESQHWLLGLMFLLDPGLSALRKRWSPALFAELRKTALQALVCTLPSMPPDLITKYELIRRVMWYIEWYSESPYEVAVLYWCVRLLQTALSVRNTRARTLALRSLLNTHGVIILMHLCYTLLEQKCPPVEKSQAVLGVAARILASAAARAQPVSCAVYPLRWPDSAAALASAMLRAVLAASDRHLLVSDRWLVSLLNFIWETIVWKKEFRERFVQKNGVYKLLDLITMSSPSVQCIALAVLCDVVRSGGGVAHLVTWRAGLGASTASAGVVRRGATVATLLAAVYRNDCRDCGVRLDQQGLILNLESPLMSAEVRKALSDPKSCGGKNLRTPECIIAADLAGSRMSKAFALLHMLSEDLAYKVSYADESYKLYKNIPLAPEDETVLLLCYHYMTFKLNETWVEIKAQSPGFLSQDEEMLNEFLEINKGWAKEIRRQQEDVLIKHEHREAEEESSLYALLARVRLNSALDALRDVRCAARSAMAAHPSTPMGDAPAAAPDTDILTTYRQPLDDQNMTGQYVKVCSIKAKDRAKTKYLPD